MIDVINSTIFVLQEEMDQLESVYDESTKLFGSKAIGFVQWCEETESLDEKMSALDDAIKALMTLRRTYIECDTTTSDQ